MRNKRLLRTLSALCLTLVLASGFTVPAFAQGAAPPPAEDTTNDSNVVVEETEKAPPLTPEGNAALVDDFGGNKQLITVTTKAGNYFYILIDRANEDKKTAVHFLNQVDEADLMALMEDGNAKEEPPAVCSCTKKCEAGAVNTACPVCVTDKSKCTGKAPEPPAETPEPEKEEQSPVSWLMPEKEKKSPVSWMVPGKEPELIESFQPVWKRAARKLAENYGTGGLRRGRNRGGKKETLSGIEKRAYDYRRFLKRFTVTREEMELDLDSFDPVAYHYGLMYYGNFPFIEPPETREGNRLEELVIAIDTSGSCKKEIVAKFLGETRSILEEKENFFSRWNVCLIQCDSFVQDVTMIHSPKEWEAYRETITIKGRGGTDFRPVFQKVEELRKQHVFRNLKALIYFTDGDGIYPEQKPDYETAFVFVRQTEKMNLVPKWAKKLLTEECTL